MSGTIRVACATDSGELIDGHFGSCRAFLVYLVSPETVEFVNALSTAAADEAEDRNKARAALIGDCQIACFQSIGGPAAAKVVRAGTHPLKVAPNTRVDDMLAKLQQALTSPPPWLAKVMGVEAASLAAYRELAEVEEE
jgi:nitrogen fixation protein NifX